MKGRTRAIFGWSGVAIGGALLAGWGASGMVNWAGVARFLPDHTTVHIEYGLLWVVYESPAYAAMYAKTSNLAPTHQRAAHQKTVVRWPGEWNLLIPLEMLGSPEWFQSTQGSWALSTPLVLCARGPGSMTLAVPAWTPGAIVGACGGGLLLTRRRRRAGGCEGCSYDRAGLLPTAPCPECGRTVAHTEPASP